MEERALTVCQQPLELVDYAMAAEGVVRQVKAISDMMAAVMKKDEHYGVIPGTQKPTLLKPGAEKLGTMFRFATSFQVEEKDLGNGHMDVKVTTTLTHIPTNTFVGQGIGSCSTMESKYRFRKAEQKCPECGKETIIKGKKEYGGGWLCYQKKGGCGAKYKDGDPQIENQNMGRVEYDNPADYWNVVRKMAKKRSHVDAILTATAASDIFTQDIEDMQENGTISTPKQYHKPPAQEEAFDPSFPPEADHRPPEQQEMLDYESLLVKLDKMSKPELINYFNANPARFKEKKFLALWKGKIQERDAA